MKCRIICIYCIVLIVTLPTKSQYSKYNKNYIFVGAGYGVASITHSGLLVAIDEFNLQNTKNHGLSSELSPPSFFRGPVINLGIVNTKKSKEWTVNFGLGIYQSKTSGEIFNYNQIESFELKNNLFLFSLGAAYIPFVLNYADIGVGLSVDVYFFEILSKTSNQAFFKHDDIVSFGLNLMSNIHTFPLGKNRSFLLSFQPYYHINLRGSVFADIFTFDSENMGSDKKGFFSHPGIKITINQPYSY